MHGAKKAACAVLLLKHFISPSFATSCKSKPKQRQDKCQEKIKKKQNKNNKAMQLINSKLKLNLKSKNEYST
jgi:hypothetical protein